MYTCVHYNVYKDVNSLSLSMDMLTSILGQRLHLNVCVYAKSLSKDWLVARV